jgi:NhaA family Na+:H+ antiporter
VSQVNASNRLDRPVNDDVDHILGPATAPITLVEYGSYACPHCRLANERIAQARDQLGERLRYVFRHRPLTGSDIALRAAELAERAADHNRFWDAHVALMTRSNVLTEDDLAAVARDLSLSDDPDSDDEADDLASRASARDEYSWPQLIGAWTLAGIGFTMSLFIAGQAFPQRTDFVAAKIAVFAASIVSAVIGTAILWHTGRPTNGERATRTGT